ncbi:hypothetical protein SAMN05660742_11321 [Propionispira arboris]|uniref:AAA+ ATPase domain-containing protein n=1 Tax=Propionispira arboris TaxID=84035 RepID=A0A1H7AZ35_9FIRM|nr:ATP-binding protein [Propionispira arboris]SEJ66325.1 hypothetical protein SAMN05660742_11321 [Propionispira arboris]
MTQSAELTGGAGFSFEAAVAAFYMAALLEEDTAPALHNRIVSRVALQQAAFGEPLDDIIVDAHSNSGELGRLSLQVKRSLTVSIAASNTDFREIVKNSWATLLKEGFRENIDRYGAAVGTISEASWRDLYSVCDFARASLTYQTFFQRFNENGNAGSNHLRIVEVFRTLLNEYAGQSVTDCDLYCFLKHFVLIKFDFLHDEATAPVEAIKQLRHTLAISEQSRASDLWVRLVILSREGAGRSEEFSRLSLLAKLAGEYRFTGASSMKAALDLLTQLTHLWLEDITSEIDDFHVARRSLLEEINSLLASHRFIQIKGLPGTGKSVLLKEIVQSKLDDGTVLFLKSDRLNGNSWATFANSIGLTTQNTEILLSEIAVTGTPTLFIDGIDRIQPTHRKIVLDLVNTIINSPVLSCWRFVVTSRDVGIEPLRNWLPAKLFSNGGVGTVTVEPLNDDEAKILAIAKPELRALLFAAGRVKEIARRPFFAYVLARGISAATMQTSFVPQSEVNLIEAWWDGGGYHSESQEIFKRQHALEELARVSARRFGLKILYSELSISTTEILHNLINDGIIREMKKGIACKFAHDIFFEWSEFYLLRRKDENWIDALIDAGEPPILGRVVELLSQSFFPSEQEWLAHLMRIEVSVLRSQWQRAWLLGPFGMPDFKDSITTFEKAISQDNYRRLRSLFVWFQAEKTVPNKLVLNGQLISTELPSSEIIRIADILGWPSDFSTWRRLIMWTLEQVDYFPCTVIPDIISVFEVWQNAFANYQNVLSDRIVKKCLDWLIDIEDKLHPEERSYNLEKWRELDHDNLKNLETSLRRLVLRSTRTASAIVKAYLERAILKERIRNEIFPDVIDFSVILAEQLPNILAELTCAELKEELPEDIQKRWKTERHSMPFSQTTLSSHDWNHLSVGRDHQVFSPPSPLREPFNSLFNSSSQQALELIRDLLNHVMTAWLQLHKLSHENRGTPIPVVIEFSWGQQTFWGDCPEYGWFRGWSGPEVVQCALMALENWAFQEIEEGRDVDSVLHDVIQGHQSCSVLGIAIAIILETQHVSKTTLAILACQRLWHIDLRRQLEEHPNIPSNLIGFTKITGQENADKLHFEAVKAANGRKCRRMSLRDLTPLFIWNQDEDIRQTTREALVRFPVDLPFAYEEEKASQSRVKEFLSTAEIWAEWGKQGNYKMRPNAGDESSVIVQLENPKLETPEMQAKLTHQAENMRELTLWNWVHKTFEKNSLCCDMGLAEVFQIAKEFDRPDLFSSRTSDNTKILGSVAGVAAAILCFNREDPENTLWASEVIARAYDTPEIEHTVHSSRAILPWHPCIFVARALTAEIQQYSDPVSKEKLLVLAGHPLECISLEALKGAFDCWNVDNRLAWAALDLGLRLSIGSRRGVRSAYGYDSMEDEKSRQQSVNKALEGYWGNQTYIDLTPPPQPWVQTATKKNVFGKLFASAQTWHEPDRFWRWDYAPKVLKLVPIEKIMLDPARRAQFMCLCDSFLSWTFEKINPSWQNDASQKKDRKKTALFAWKRELSRLLANISGYLDTNVVRTRFLNPILVQEDELCASFLAPFITTFTCIYILDTKIVGTNAIQILDICVDRLLLDHTFKKNGYKDGVLYGSDLPYIVRDLFFISVENADGAARFANGRWEEIHLVLPIIDKFVRNTGWASTVASAFLTLCERCGPCYPVELFADQLLAFLDINHLPGWRGTTLPARIAGLIQIYADRRYPLEPQLAQKMLRILDILVNLGDRRSAALQSSEAFRDVRISQ